MNSMSLQNAQQKPARRARQSHRNTEGIKKFSEQKTLLAFQKAEAAIDRLVQEKETVNFNTVSIEAGVSKPFLYTHTELRHRIESLRWQTEEQEKEGTLYKSLKQENERLWKEIQKLRELLLCSSNSVIS